MEDLMFVIAKGLGIPITEKERNMWFLRTKSGRYYYDYRINGFAALGWDRVSSKLIYDEISYDEKKKKIEEIYPEESRPGLILSQMEIFYKKMQCGDLIIIPSRAGKQISIGIIGDFIEKIERHVIDGDYDECKFTHKRKVEWLKDIVAWQDIYLFRELRGQQTITNITSCADLIYRNIYPCYISSDSVHLTLNKVSESEYSASNNLLLLSALLDIIDNTSELYGGEKLRDEVKIKTAVGSPGFIELILPNIPVSAIIIGIIIKALIGKTKSKEGTITDGILAIISKVNDLVNDHVERQKIIAEKELAVAQIEKVRAEAKKIEAETKRIEIENREKMEMRKITMYSLVKKEIGFEIPDNKKMQSRVVDISKNVKALVEAANESGIKDFGP